MCKKSGPCNWFRHAIGVWATGNAFGYDDRALANKIEMHLRKAGLSENWFRRKHVQIQREMIPYRAKVASR